MNDEEAMNEPTQHDDLDETAPDSGTARASERAVHALDEDFESEHERRFFSEPPPFSDEHTQPSLQPFVAETEHAAAENDTELLPSVEQRAWLERAHARRAKLRRWVGLAISSGALALVVAGADRYLSAHREPAGLVTTSAFTAHVAPERAAPAKAIPTRPTEVPLPVEPLELATATASPTAKPVSTSIPTAVAATPPVTAPAPSAAPAAPEPRSLASQATSSADATTLIAKARALLNTGHTRDGVALARTAVDTDPLDARSYVLLGAGLQDLGDWAAARSVFQDCARKATRGPSATCQYFARR